MTYDNLFENIMYSKYVLQGQEFTVKEMLELTTSEELKKDIIKHAILSEYYAAIFPRFIIYEADESKIKKWFNKIYKKYKEEQ
jgi:hypothetical protein